MSPNDANISDRFSIFVNNGRLLLAYVLSNQAFQTTYCGNMYFTVIQIMPDL